MAGAGVAMLPTYQAGVHIHSGELVRLLSTAEPREMSVYAVYASRKHMPTALRSLLDFLVIRFPEEPQWDAYL
ncbi:LysR substrate binding domain protein [compost metagenome]